MNSPLISVVMPVYNCERYIRYSMESVFAQTMTDFELIVVNDGSSDSSGEIAHSFLDNRLKVIDLPENSGCYPARNIGMRAVKGKYICVMDADDVCLPQRLEKQYRFMEDNPDIGLAGSAYIKLPSNQPIFREPEHETIKLFLLKDCCLNHPTCIIRTSLVGKYGLFYNETYRYASDYDWQVRASSLFPIAHLMDDPMLLYRMHDEQISTAKKREQSVFADQIRVKQLSFFEIEPTEREKALHLAFIKDVVEAWIDEEMIDQWIKRLLDANKKTRYFVQQKLKKCFEAHRYLLFHQKT